MANGASIVVDIKAQISGYEEQIEKIKQQLKKVDPGSTIGKGLLKTLEQAETKITQLSHKAEQRISSQSQLEHLYDQLRNIETLMNNLGQGMQNVGINDVLMTSSEEAKKLNQSIQETQNAMQSSGKTFFDDLTKGTHADQLKAVMDQLKFDPKTMGIDQFVSSFEEAIKSAKKNVQELEKEQQEAQGKLESMQALQNARNALPVNMQMGKPNKSAISDYLGLSSFLDKSNQQESRISVVQDFLSQIRAGLESDKTHTDTEKGAIDSMISSIAQQLLDAKDQKEIESVLQQLQQTLTQGTHFAASAGIGKLTNASMNEWSTRFQESFAITEDFKQKVTQIQDLVKDTPLGQQGQLGQVLEALLNPKDAETFQQNVGNLITILQTCLQQINAEVNQMDVKEQKGIVDSIDNRVTEAKNELNNLSAISNTTEYQNLVTRIGQLESELSTLRQQLGLENTSNAQKTASEVNQAGKNASQAFQPINQQNIQNLQQYTTMLENAQQRQQMMGKVEGIAQRWFSVYAAVRMVGKAFRSIKQNVTNLDTTMTEIAIVTNKSQSDLWNQMPEYTSMARKYGSSIEGVYKVSQLYYQQGLQQEDVMALTEQTLKMARISGLDYADATNYMTNAIRSFKIEMQDAQTVVDVYSALAASSASSTSELATAMSKTASSAAAVGSSFESTSAMMAVMIETTRESPENIGSALKSIISRYGELKENKTGIDEEGEEYSLNKVDTALQSVGISLHDAKGEFRDFDDVIMELSQSWDTIDKNTQRYIATVMAGNRQQSRFLALVSNGERLAELTEIAENSEDASTLQVLKTMDSIAFKTQTLQTNLQSLYTDSGIENLYKGILDGANQIIKTFTDMPTLFELPIPALASFAMNFISIANVVMTGIQMLRNKFQAQWDIDQAKKLAKQQANNARELQEEQIKEEAKTRIRQEENQKREQSDITTTGTNTSGTLKLKTSSKLILGAQLAGSVMNIASGLISDKGNENRALKATLGIGGSILQYGAIGAMLTPGKPLLGAGIGAALGGLMGVWQNIQYIWESTEDQAKRLKQEAEELTNTSKQKTATTNNLAKEIKEWNELSKAQYDSAEAREKFIEASNKLGTSVSDIVSYYDEEGNAVIELGNAYAYLKRQREEADDSFNKAAQSSLNAAVKNTQAKKELLQNKKVQAEIDMNVLGANDKKSKELLDNIRSQAEEIGDQGFSDSLNYELYQLNLNELASRASRAITSESTPGLYQITQQLGSKNGKQELIQQLSNNENRSQLLTQWKEEVSNISDDLSRSIMEFVIYQLETSSQTILTAEKEYKDAINSERSTERSIIAQYVSRYRQEQEEIVNFSNNDERVRQASSRLDAFKEISGGAEWITDYLYNNWINMKDKLSWNDYEKILEGADSPLDAIITGLSSLSKEARDQLNELYEKRGSYNIDQFKNKLRGIIGDNDQLFNMIMTSVENYYKKLLSPEEFGQALEQRRKEDKITISKETETAIRATSNITGGEYETIIATADSINKMYESGNISKQNGQKFLDKYTSLWSFSNEAQQAILSSITDFSDEGLEAALDLVDKSDDLTDEEKEKLKKDLPNLFNLITKNLNTALKSYEEKMVAATESYTKDMSSATKGMDYKSAVEMAEKLSISATSEYFDVKNGQMFLKDTQLIYDYYFGDSGILSKLNKQITTTTTELQSHIEQLKELKEKDISDITAEWLEERGINVDVNTVKAMIKAWQDTDEDLTADWINTYFRGKIESAENFTQSFLKSEALNRAISSGNLLDMVKAGVKYPTRDENRFTYFKDKWILPALQSGDFSNVISTGGFTDEFISQLPKIKSSYDEAQSAVVTKLVDGVTDGFSYIEGTEFNQDLLKKLASDPYKLVELLPPINGIQNAIITASAKNVLKFLESYEEAGQAGELGLSTSQLREKIASLRSDAYKKSSDGILQTILSNYDNIEETTYKAFADKWEFSKELFTRKADGTYKTRLPDLIAAIKNGEVALDQLTQEKMIEVVTQAISDGTTAISSAADYLTKGTTRYSDMQDFVKKYNEISTIQADVSDLFKYDLDQQSFVLNFRAYNEFLRNERSFLMSLGQDTSEIDNLIASANQSIINAIDVSSYLKAENRGINSKAYNTFKKQLMNADIWSVGVTKFSESYASYLGLAAKELNLSKDDSRVEQRAKMIAKNYKKINDQNREAIAESMIKQIENGGEQAVLAYNMIAQMQNKELTAEEISSAYFANVTPLEKSIDQLEFGIGKLVDGKTVEILERAGYKIERLGATDSAVVKGIGDISTAYENYYNELVKTNNATLEALNNAKAKVLETKDHRYEEQQAISALSNAAGMTYSEFAAILTAEGIELTDTIVEQYTESLGGNKIRIKDFASFARAMKWDFDSEEYISGLKNYNDGLVERKTKLKKELETEVKGLESLEPGDWLNVTYLERELKKVSKDNKQKIKGMRDNLEIAYGNHNQTQIDSYTKTLQSLEAEDPFGTLELDLAKLGAYFDDGVLKLTDDANLLGIVEVFTEKLMLAIENGMDIDPAEVKDLMSNVLKAYTDAIIKGIQGNLSNTEAKDLISKASDMGISLSEADFTATTKGLRLSTQSAAALYFKMSQIDALQGRLVFDELNTSLKESDDHFKDLTSLMTHMAQLAKEITDSYNPEDGGELDARVKSAEQELALVKEIAMYRMLTSDEDWHVTGKKTLAQTTRHIVSYIQDTAEVMEKYNNWKEKNYIPYSDADAFSDYGMGLIDIADRTGKAINWMGLQLGGTTGLSPSQFQEAIQASYISYVDEKGTVTPIFSPELLNAYLSHYSTSGGHNYGQLDLTQGVQQGFSEGQEAYRADSEEKGRKIAAVNDFFTDMEFMSRAIANKWKDVGDINKLIDSDGTLHLDEMSESFQESLLASAEHFQVGGESLARAVKTARDEGTKLSKAQKEAVQTLIDFASSDEWDWENPYQSLKEHMQKYGKNEQEVQLGDFTYKLVGDQLLTYDIETGVWLTEDGKSYTSEEKAIKHVNEQQVESFVKGLGNYYDKEKGEYSITFDTEYIITIDEKGKLHLQSKNGDGELDGHIYDDYVQMVNEQYDAYQAEVLPKTLQDQIAGKEHVVRPISKEAYKLQLRAPEFVPAPYKPGQTLSAESREALQKQGFQSIQEIQETWQEMVQTYGNTDDAMAEWELKFHTRFTPDENGDMSNEIAQAYLEEANMSEAVANIVNGLSKALQSEAVQNALGEAIDKGITQSLKSDSELEVEAPTIVIKPSEIIIDTKNVDVSFKSDLKSVMDEVEITPTQGSSYPIEQKKEEILAAYEEHTGVVTEQQPIIEQPTELSPFTVPVTPTLATGAESFIENLGEQTVTVQANITADEEATEGLEDKEVIVTANAETDEAQAAINNITGTDVTVSVSETGVSAVKGAIDGIEGKTIYITVKEKDETGGSGEGATGGGKAAGNVGLATGNARAAGTLMGELGPELVVQNGRYFVAGQNGAEFVDLANDAIIFNHLQTERLFKNGMSPDRGRAVTNERVAAAFAHGNWNGGEARATVSTAGSQTVVASGGPFFTGMTKALDAAVESEQKKAGQAGSEEVKALKSYVRELEKWFNWLQKIAQLEKQINIEQAKRTAYTSSFERTGSDYFNSQLKNLKLLQSQVEVQKDLNEQRKEYFKTVRAELNSGAFGKIYEFDENFQPVYKEGMYEWLQDIFSTNPTTGNPKYTAAQQYQRLSASGYGKLMEYDSSGNQIDKSKDGWEQSAVKAFDEKLQKDLEKGQKYHDDLMDGEQKLWDLENNENEILKDIEDNQLSVEQKIVKAIEDSRQKEIDEQQSTRDAIEKSNSKLIDSLNNQLTKEQNMYSQQESVDELSKLERQLAILQRSGGSATQIADLQQQITEKQKDLYFDMQQKQIEALQEASDNELERLDQQIDLMKETLEYQKANGLLYTQVYEVLKGTPEEIVNFIKINTTEYLSKSAAELEKVVREDLFQVDRFKQFAAKVEGGLDALVKGMGFEIEEEEVPISTDVGNSVRNMAERQGLDVAEMERKAREAAAQGASSAADMEYYTKWYQTDNGEIGVVSVPVKNHDYTQAALDMADKMATVPNVAYADDHYDDLPAVARAMALTEIAGYTNPDISTLTMNQDFYQNHGWSKTHTINPNYESTLGFDQKSVWYRMLAYAVADTVEENAQKASSKNITEYYAFGDGLYKIEQGKDGKHEYVPASVKEQKKMGYIPKTESDLLQSSIFGKASGGYVGHGYYELGELGTETVLTAEQTQVLRNNILSNRPDSLINLLKSYNEAYHGLSDSTYDSLITNNGDMVNIERAEVNLQIEKLADDYDSQRAANTIMDEMLRIASKTKANNSVRR